MLLRAGHYRNVNFYKQSIYKDVSSSYMYKGVKLVAAKAVLSELSLNFLV